MEELKLEWLFWCEMVEAAVSLNRTEGLEIQWAHIAGEKKALAWSRWCTSQDLCYRCGYSWKHGDCHCC
jgi:hypothetical protein